MNLKLTFAILLLLLSFTYAQSLDSQISSSPFDLIRDWRALSLGISILSVILISIALLIGMSFEMPELKAWASSELTQVFATLLIVLALAGTITLLDGLFETLVVSSNLGFTCSGTSICAKTVASNYLDNLISLASSVSKSSIEDYATAAKLVGLGTAVNSEIFVYPIPLLQPQISFSPTISYMMDMDRLRVVIEGSGGIFASLSAQKFFVNEISYKLAPSLLAIGILLRSFFATRRLGGLLMAIGFGVMYVFPMTYVFDWLSLNIAVSGGNLVVDDTTNCPVSCLKNPPTFVIDNNNMTFESREEVLDYLDSTGTDISGAGITLAALASGTQPSAMIGSYRIISCNANECPSSCRSLPYPNSPSCFANSSNCASIDSRCKVIRSVNLVDTPDTFAARCPMECRTVPALKSNCDISRNVGSRSLTCIEILADPSIDSTGCPAICATGLGASDPTCNVPIPIPVSYNCLDSKDYCRYARSDNLNVRPSGCEEDLASYVCPASLTANDSCVWVLPSRTLIDSHACDRCLFVPQEFQLTPPINTACEKACSDNSQGPRKISPAEFTRRSSEGMIGKEEIKSLASLYLPAYLLPLLNLVMTLVFIRGFSQFLGGDVEIPGLARLL